jgi:hypothetical protein
MKKIYLLIIGLAVFTGSKAQAPDEDQLGTWYMYFFQKRFSNSQWGVQGDYQLRMWEPFNDLEQLLLRTGITWRPKSDDILFTLGYAHIRSGIFGDSDEIVPENRVYQEALIPQKLAKRFLLTHRFRYEQRWIENQDFRTRFRYNLFVNVPVNKTSLEKNAIYIALYNEIFINGETRIGNNQAVQLFDRNRTYLGGGYSLSKTTRTQLGWMKQKTVGWGKGQLQVSVHQAF